MSEECNWVIEDYDANLYKCNACELLWVLEDGTPEYNEMNYCPKCGKKINHIYNEKLNRYDD